MKHLFIPVLALFSLTAMAQIEIMPNDHEPNKTVVEGRYWNYVNMWCGYDYDARDYESHEDEANGYHFDGEVVLDDKIYSIFRDGDGNGLAYMREEDGKVYLRTGETALDPGLNVDSWEYDQRDDTAPEVLLYDFQLDKDASGFMAGFDNNGESFGCIQCLTVLETFTEYNSSINYNCQRMGINNYYRDHIMIEGIGSLIGRLHTPVYGMDVVSGGYDYHVLKNVTDAEGNIIYESPMAHLGALKGSKLMNDQMYNLQGMPIDRAVPGSIVIKGGKKYIVPRN